MKNLVTIELTDRQKRFIEKTPEFNFQDWINMNLDKRIGMFDLKSQKVSAIIAAAGYEKRIYNIEREIPKPMLKIKGISLLERQVAVLRSFDITSIVIVRGFKKEQINIPDVTYIDNDDYDKTGNLHSFFLALNKVTDRSILSYGDIHYEKAILKELLISDSEFTIVIDRSWRDHYHNRTQHTISEAELVKVENNHITHIGIDVEYDAAYGEFIGLASFSPSGLEKAKNLFKEIEQGENPEIDSSFLKKALLSDFINHLIKKGEKIVPLDIHGGWFEIDTFEDYKKSWTQVQ